MVPMVYGSHLRQQHDLDHIRTDQEYTQIRNLSSLKDLYITKSQKAMTCPMYTIILLVITEDHRANKKMCC